MGTQQLFLVILTTVIISIATTIAITSISKTSITAMEEDFTVHMLRVVSDVEAFWHRPEALGGGSHSFNEVNFNTVPCPFNNVGTDTRECINDELGEKLGLYSAPDSVVLVAQITRNNQTFMSQYVIYPETFRLSMPWQEVNF